MASESSSSSNDIVTLNVGGQLYATRRATLLSKQSSGGGETFFHALLSGRLGSLRDKDGNYFIDRDGKIFYYIMEYLRRGSWRLDGLGDADLDRVFAEARFYLLEVENDYVSALRGGQVLSDSHIDNYHEFLDTESSRKTESDLLKAYNANEERWKKVKSLIHVRLASLVADKKRISNHERITPLFVAPNFAFIRDRVLQINHLFPSDLINFDALIGKLKSALVAKGIDLVEDAAVFQADPAPLCANLAKENDLNVRAINFDIILFSSDRIIVCDEATRREAYKYPKTLRSTSNFTGGGVDETVLCDTTFGWLLVRHPRSDSSRERYRVHFSL